MKFMMTSSKKSLNSAQCLVFDMKIIGRKEFLKLGEGYVFSKYEPCIFGEMSIKGSSSDIDFFYQDVTSAIDAEGSGDFSDLLFAAKDEGKSLNMDFDCMGRDGMFDNDQLFAVWELADVDALIVRLKEARKDMLKNQNLKS